MVHTLPPLYRLRTSVLVSPILAGLALLLLLPIGIFLGTSSILFEVVFFLHILLLIRALTYTAEFFIEMMLNVSWANWLALVVGSLAIIVIAMEGSLPITARDALIHHLAVPKWWVESGYISEVKWHEWSFYPMLINLGFAGLLANGLIALAPLYHAVYLILLCGAVGAFLMRVTQDAEISLFGLLLTLTLPICLRLASSPVVDLGLALYTFIAFFFLIEWTEQEGNPWHLVAGGTALGLALGCKYNGILAAIVMVPVFLLYAARSLNNAGAALRGTALFAVTALLVFSPWLIKNTIWTGNPIYPLMNFLFNPGSSTGGGGGLSPLEQRLMLYNEDFWEVLLIPIRMLIFGVDDNPRQFDGTLTPVFLLALLPCILNRNRRWAFFLSFSTLLYIVLALLTASARVRYLMPVLGPTVCLTSVAILEMSHRWRISRDQLLSGISLLHLVWVTLYVIRLFDTTGTLHYIQSKQTSADYLQEHISEFSMIQYVNKNLSDNALVYLLYTGNKFYYYSKPVRSGGHFSAREIIPWISQSETEVELLNRLRKKEAITHIAANSELLNKSFDDQLLPAEKAVWDAFASKHLAVLFQDGPFVVWSIQ